MESGQSVHGIAARFVEISGNAEHALSLCGDKAKVSSSTLVIKIQEEIIYYCCCSMFRRL